MRIWLALILMLSTLTASLPASAKKRGPVEPSRQQNNFLNGLAKRCSNGNGQSCYDYAQTLRQFHNKADEKKILQYTRRACQLAYVQACNRPEKPEPARMAASRTHTPASKPGDKPACGTQTLSSAGFANLDMGAGRRGLQITRMSPGNILERAGIRLGDIITKVNGAEFVQNAQLGRALDDGTVMLEVTRGGSAIPLAINCY